MADWSSEIEKKIPKEESKENTVLFDDTRVASLIKEVSKKNKNGCLNMLVLGADGVGKSGIVVDFCSKLKKPSIIIDLDGGNSPLVQSYYKENTNLRIINPLQTTETENGTEIDYKKTMAFIKALVRYVKRNPDDFSAIVLDGLSTLLKHAEYQMRIEKNINIDGGVNLKYWVNRSKMFMEILEIMKSIDNSVHKFYIGHEDFIVNKKDPQVAAVKLKTNQLIHQRLICKKINDMGDIEFKARIDKSKYNINKEGKEIIFAKVSDTEKMNWNPNEIFKGLY